MTGGRSVPATLPTAQALWKLVGKGAAANRRGDLPTRLESTLVQRLRRRQSAPGPSAG